MATFTGTSGVDIADAINGNLIGFIGGTLAELQDATGDTIEGNQGADVVIAGAGNDSIRGEIGADFLDGRDGVDVIEGGNNADTIIGGAGADRLYGEDGDDTFRFTAATDLVSGEVISGGGGSNTIQVTSPETYNFSVNISILDIQTFDFAQTSGTIQATFTPDRFGTGLFYIQTIDGSVGIDVIMVVGASIDMSLLSFTNWTNGIDIIILDSTSNSGATVTGSSQNDSIAGGAGADTFFGLGGDDVFLFSNGSHVVAGETFDGGTGNDAFGLNVAGTYRFDQSGVSITSVEILRFTHTSVLTAHFQGTQFGVGTIATVEGSSSTDRLSIFGTAVDLNAVSFTGWTNGFDSIEILGSSVVASTLTGSSQNDSFVGGSQADILSGNAGNDTLNGGAGDDMLTGGLGADTLDGGTGFDYARYESSSVGVTANLIWQAGVGGDAQGDAYNGIEGFVGSLFDDVLVGNGETNVISGQGGNDLIYLGEGLDAAYGMDDNDTIIGQGGTDYINGNNGNDLLSGEADTDYLSGDAGNDTIYGGAARDYIYSGTGNDLLYGEADDDVFDFRGDTVAGQFDTIVDFQDFQNGAVTNDYIALSAAYQASAVIWNPGGGLIQIAIPLAGGNYMINVTGTSIANIADNIIWV